MRILPTNSKVFHNVNVNIVQTQLGFYARHSTTLVNHVIFNFNCNMPTIAVYVNIEKPLT